MVRKNILVLSKNYFNFTDLPIWDSWARAMMVDNHVEFWGTDFPEYKNGLHVDDLVKAKFGGEEVDYIFQFHNIDYWVEGLKDINIPKIMVVADSDAYANHEELTRTWNRDNIDLVMFRTWPTTSHKWRTELRNSGYSWLRDGVGDHLEFDIMEKFKEECRFPVVSLPLAIDPTMYRDYGLPKIYDVSMIGRCYGLYPLRRAMGELISAPKFNARYKFFNSPGLGYSNKWLEGTMREEQRKIGCLWGDDYARRINESRMMMTDGSVYNVAVSKYFEAPACKTLLLAPFPDNYEELHFEDGVNMVNVNAKNMEERLYYYLENDSECKKVTENGFNMTHKYHTAEVRNREQFKMLEEYL